MLCTKPFAVYAWHNISDQQPWPIYTRTRQHINIIKRREVEKSALAEHYVEQHPDNTAEPNINFCAVATTREELHLLIEKTYWIQRPKPALNRKQDNMGTGFPRLEDMLNSHIIFWTNNSLTVLVITHHTAPITDV